MTELRLDSELSQELSLFSQYANELDLQSAPQTSLLCESYFYTVLELVSAVQLEENP